ncbi:MAG: T9SS type A sorting domain-containing protein [Niastella sp.]|nr:T9SS type A sorting domain-containing protein [Niastella sp.]
MKRIFILCLLTIPALTFAQAYTPKCSYVSVFTQTEFTPSEIAYYNSAYTSAYPSATLIGNASTTYNCHNYAWNKSDGGGTYWMNTPGDDTYWTDGSYVEVSQHATPYATKVSYASDDHSAITTSNPNVHISKWGAMPLMQHAPNYTPYDETTLKYYSVPISGTANICNGSEVYTTFTSSGVSSYTWTAGSSITPASQTSSSNSFTASTIYTGTSSLSVSMSSTCSGTTVGATRAIALGNGPLLGGLKYNGGYSWPDPVCQNAVGQWQVLEHPNAIGGVSLAWSFTNCYSGYPYGTLVTTSFNGPISSMAMVKVEATGACGVGENYTVYLPIADCGLPPVDWRVYPNPVKGGSVTVELPFEPGRNAVLQIFDKNLVKRREVRLQSASMSISLAGLPAGIIYLTVTDGKNHFKKIIIKE